LSDHHNAYDVVIIGGGLSGLSLACVLGASGVNTLCLDAAPRFNPEKAGDLRTTAISWGSHKILDRAGIWAELAPEACPITDIEILDGDSPVLLEFLSSEIGDKPFGWICANADLRAALQERAAALETVTHIPACPVAEIETGEDGVSCTAQDGRVFTARLLVGADGRQSFVRRALEIPERGWEYGQRAVICTAAHENPHNNIAVEHFHPQGPFAILPMSDGHGDSKNEVHRSSVVFTEHGPARHSLMKMDDQCFEAALATRFPARYGDVRVIGQRAVYPLSLVHAARYTGPRTALIADAAHGIHPIAGQGLNLGFRDVARLADLIREAQPEEIGAPDMLAEYERRRRPDNTAMVAVTDGLVKLFSNDLAPVKLARRLGLKGVARLPAAKRFFMKQAMGDR